MNQGVAVGAGDGGSGDGDGSAGEGGDGEGAGGGSGGDDASGDNRDAPDYAKYPTCGTESHPVDVVTGRVFTHPIIDLQLPGPLPFSFQRSYSSSASKQDQGLGWGWGHSLGWFVEVKRRRVRVWNERGAAAGRREKEPVSMSAQPAEPIATAKNPFASARAHATTVEGILSDAEMIRKPHSDVEELLDARGREWARLMYQEHLALRAALERRTHVVGAEGVERTSTRESGRHLETVFGRVGVERLAYQVPAAAQRSLPVIGRAALRWRHWK